MARKQLVGRILAATVAATVGVGASVAVSAMPGNTASTPDLTVAAGQPLTGYLGTYESEPGYSQHTSTIDWGDGGYGIGDVLCPPDRDAITTCQLAAPPHTYTLPAGVPEQTYTITNFVAGYNPDTHDTHWIPAAQVVTVAAPAEPQVTPSTTSTTALADTPVGATSAPKAIIIANGARAAGLLHVGAAAVQPATADLTITADGCAGQALAPGASCTIAVALQPRATGARTGAVAVPLRSIATTTTASFAFAGTGLAPAAPPAVTVTTPAPPAVTVTTPTATTPVNGASAKPDCVVPALKGKTLAQARAALRAHHCTLGTVTKPRHSAKGARLVVASQGTNAGTKHAADAKVSVRLAAKSTKKHPAKH
jgi:hypothetical protein